MKRLLITDLDGTLLSTDSKVSPKSAEIISGLSENGAMITVATARTPATVEPLLHNTLTTVPAIVMTGAAMWDRAAKRYMATHLLPCTTALHIIDTMKKSGVEPFVYTLASDGMLKVTHTISLTRHEDKFYQERRSLELKKFQFLPDSSPLIEGDGVMLLLGIGSTQAIASIANIITAESLVSVSAYTDIFNPRISYIEIFASGVSKAAAILQLKQLTGADHVTVYGDNLNDLPMFEVADESVAVANARPEVLEAATRIIGPNTADSVALDMAAICAS